MNLVSKNYAKQIYVNSRPDGIDIPKLSEDSKPDTVTNWPAYTPPPEIQLPSAPGTTNACLKYVNGEETPTLEDSYYQPQRQFTDNIGNECWYISLEYNVTLEEFGRWNPTLYSGSNCTLLPGYRYCVDHLSRGM